jgi:IMP dehydrogenase
LELGQIMKRRDQVVTAHGLDVDSAQAYAIMKQRLVKKLPVVDPRTDQLLGMYVWRDVANNQRQVSSFSLDDNGNFLVAAAVGCGDAELKRARALVQAGARIIVIDSSHGACQDARQLLRALKREFRDAPLQVIVGNIASYASAQFLLERDPSAADAREADLLLPDALKVGIGPGSICTTRRVTGTGVPQLTAVYEVVRAVRESGVAVPVIADGGVRSSGDVCKALAVGAAAVMLGNMLAGTKESAGRLVKRGKKSYKMYRGMGSLSAMAERAGSRLRYNALTDAGGDPAMLSERLTVDERTKVVAEGVEGLVEVTSDLPAVIQVLVGGIAGGFAHSGARTMAQFRARATFWTQSNIGAQEGKVHDVLQVTE